MNIRAEFLARAKLSALLTALTQAGYRCIGPQLRDGAIVFDELHSVADLPQGIMDEQSPGAYRLISTDQPYLFAFTTCVQGLKPYLFAPREPLWTSTQPTQNGLSFTPLLPEYQPLAIIGPRACDISGMLIQDRHFRADDRSDPYYARRRENLLIVAVQCIRSTATCLCSSTGDGPHIKEGFDLRLTEVEDGFVIQSGSTRGEQLMLQLPLGEVSDAQLAAAEDRVNQAAVQQRALPSVDLEATLFANLDHPRWQRVAERCLSCANCTSVCPTCFCFRETDEGDFASHSRTHVRHWDSCFTQPHSYIHGITIRAETPQRYRQWLTHKLGSWHSQYGRSGCTGCGRCITWCPTGIDITEEANAICADD